MLNVKHRQSTVNASVREFLDHHFDDQNSALQLCRYFTGYPSEVWNRELIMPLLLGWETQYPHVAPLRDREIAHGLCVYKHETSEAQDSESERHLRAELRQQLRDSLKVI